MQFLKLLLLGGPKQPKLRLRRPRQGYKYAYHRLSIEWCRGRAYGIVRLIRLILLTVTFVFPIVHLDTLMDCAIQRCFHQPQSNRVDIRVVAVYRECYFVARASFLLCALALTWYAKTWIAIVTAYFIFEIVHAWLGRALAWGKHEIDPARSFLLAIFNYAEVTLAFAILYLHCGCIRMLEQTPTTIHAVYFSLVTAATVGFGDVVPVGRGYYLAIAQISVFLVFVVFVASTLVSHLSEQTRPSPPNHVA